MLKNGQDWAHQWALWCLCTAGTFKDSLNISLGLQKLLLIFLWKLDHWMTEQLGMEGFEDDLIPQGQGHFHSARLCQALPSLALEPEIHLKPEIPGWGGCTSTSWGTSALDWSSLQARGAAPPPQLHIPAAQRLCQQLRPRPRAAKPHANHCQEFQLTKAWEKGAFLWEHQHKTKDKCVFHWPSIILKSFVHRNQELPMLNCKSHKAWARFGGKSQCFSSLG